MTHPEKDASASASGPRTGTSRATRDAGKKQSTSARRAFEEGNGSIPLLTPIRGSAPNFSCGPMI